MIFPYCAEYNTHVPCYVVKKGTYKNHLYVIYSNYGLSPTAYVFANEDDWWIDADYDELNRKYSKGRKPHGGFTFGSFASNKFFDLPNPDGESFLLGWDYAHLGDYQSDSLDSIRMTIHGRNDKKWTIEEIESDCIKVIDTLEFEA